MTNSITLKGFAPGDRVINAAITIPGEGRITSAASWNWNPDADPGTGPDPDPGPGPDPDTGPTGSEQLTISVNRSEAIAPAGFYFVAEASGFGVDDHLLDLRYKWSFDEAGKYYDRFASDSDSTDPDDFIWDKAYDDNGTLTYVRDGTRPTRTGMTFLGVDKNIAYGPHTGQVFAPTADEFASEFASSGKPFIEKTITVEAVSRAMAEAGDAPITASVTIRITNPDVEFGAENTVYVSPSGNFPAEAVHTAATWEDAITEIRDSRRPRILFNRGEMHNVDLSADAGGDPVVSWRGTAYYDHMQCGAYGSGADPVLVTARSAFPSNWGTNGFVLRAEGASDSSICYWGLNRVGPYDSARPWLTPANEKNQKYGLEGIALSYSNFYTVWDCRIEGFNKCLEGVQKMENLCVGNTVIQNWNDYGFFSNPLVAFINFSGCQVKQKLGTISSDLRYDNYANHGPWRISAAGNDTNPGYVSLNASDFRSLNSWAGNFQPCIRMGGSGRTAATHGIAEDHDQPRRQRTNFDRLRLENGGGCGSGVFEGTVFPKHSVYDKMYIMLQNDTGSAPALSHGASGIDMRNMVVVVANVKKGAGSYKCAIGYRTPAGDEPVDRTVANYSTRAYGMTFVDLRDDQTFGEGQQGWALLRDDEAPFEFELSSNIILTPNRSAGTADYTMADAPLDETRKWIPAMDAFYSETNAPQSTVPSAVDGLTIPVAPLWVPATASAAYRGANLNERIPIDDLFGNLRFGPGRPTPTRGAIEPD